MNEAVYAPVSVGSKQPRRHRWSARMVRPLADQGEGTPASFLRKTFELAAPDSGATLYISAHGLYRCFINGKRVGQDLLTPGWTAYDRRLSYQTYNIGDLIHSGLNTIEIWLADGWFRSQLMWGHDAIYNCWGEHLAAIAEIRTESSIAPLVATDQSWSSGTLPIRKSGIYFGEVYDSRLETLEDSHGCALVENFDVDVLLPHEAPPVREMPPFSWVGQWRDDEGRTIYDFGQNCAGYAAFTVRGETGSRVIVEHAEIVDKRRQLENANFRTAACRVEYTLKGTGEESYRPFFTFQGFRYARVAIEGEAEIIDIKLVPISSVRTPTARFECSSPLVNRLVQNTVWSQRSNFIDVPTDCPQRDERLGWSGDAQVFAGTACYLHDSHAFLVKYVRDLIADQRENGAIAHFSPDPTLMHPSKMPEACGSTGWGDAICVIPWQLYLHYGDRRILVESLGAMERWVDFVWSISDGPIVHPPRNWSRQGFTFGDWLQPKGPSVKPLPTIGDDAAATIYLFIAAQTTARAARVVGDTDLAEKMETRAAEVRNAFQHEFITASGRLAYDDQTSYALAILHDLIPKDLRAPAVGYFKDTIERCDGRIGTGFIGTPALLPALAKMGETAWAERLFLQEKVPGWLYQVKQGATTIWERWDAIQEDGSIFSPQMNSYNHYAYGAVCQWLFEAVAGFRPDPDAPAFKRIVFEPAILPMLSPVKAGYDSAAGLVATAWQVEGDQVTYTVEVPERARGELVLASNYLEATVDGASVSDRDGGGKLHADLAAGRHEIKFRVGDLEVQRSDVSRLAAHPAFNLPA